MPLIQWIMLNLVETYCFIESESSLTCDATVADSNSCNITSTSSVIANANIQAGGGCEITSDSELICHATKKAKPTPGFENDPANLTGTYAIVPNFFGKKKYKYVHIDFSFRDDKYRNEFYSDKDIDIKINKVDLDIGEMQSKDKIAIAVNKVRMISDRDRIRELEIQVRSLRKKLRGAKQRITELEAAKLRRV